MIKKTFKSNVLAISSALFCSSLTASGVMMEDNLVPAENLDLVPTFSSLGITLKRGDLLGTEPLVIEYQHFGGNEWLTGPELWFDNRVDEFKTSLVNLDDNTRYQLRIKNGKTIIAAQEFRTWSENFPIGKEIVLPEYSDEPLVIEESGTENGYILIRPATGKRAVINTKNRHANNIVINGSYVIVRGVTVKRASESAIVISPKDWLSQQSNVVIENSDISQWGGHNQCGEGYTCQYGVNLQAGVFATGHHLQQNLTKVVIQNNRIYNPATTSNNWRQWNPESGKHPSGPQGITLYETNGQHVIRYNEIFSNNGNKFNDALGGKGNFSQDGFLNKDSDVYGNIVSDAWDDGIELEGAMKNVRVWNNIITNTYNSLATANVSQGPLYIWKNISGKNMITDNDSKGAFLKTGANQDSEKVNSQWGGRIYVYHNTVLQPLADNSARLGAHEGIVDSGGGMDNLVSKNNIIEVSNHYSKAIRDVSLSATNTFHNDLLFGEVVAGNRSLVDSIAAKPEYRANPTQNIGSINALRFGDYRLTDTSPGAKEARPIVGFTPVDTQLDVGAQQPYETQLQFGNR
ncbi:hypothetical protein F0237_06425 [Vibrio tubiashii]|uniref:Right handed beta helix domain-containing protein n=1 Tax=Vibrio tubiashii TaxID=29498 RepID=A0AAE5GNX7_9VIBR|nr:hypothetical protein [Vibrio tubiashii]NOI80300.1 hypothetical protein [Vibrio tubiashii]